MLNPPTFYWTHIWEQSLPIWGWPTFAKHLQKILEVNINININININFVLLDFVFGDYQTIFIYYVDCIKKFSSSML